MMIKARCPNAACGKTLGMKSELAGKKAKCPNCGIMFTIPGLPGTAPSPRQEELPEPEAMAAVVPAEEQSPQDYPQQYAQPQYAQPAPEAAYQPAPQKPRKRFRAKSKMDAPTMILLGIGAFLLVFLALTPLLAWAWMSVKVTAANRSQSFSASVNGMGNVSTSEGRTERIRTSGRAAEGWTILSISLTVAIVLGIGFAITAILQFRDDWSYEILTGANALAGAWGTIAAIWMLANIWKVVTAWIEVTSQLRKAKENLEGMRGRFPGAPPPDFDFSVTVLPGFGLWLGLLAAIGLAVLFTAAANRRDRMAPMLIAHAIGAGIGLLVLLFYVQPWSASLTYGSPF